MVTSAHPETRVLHVDDDPEFADLAADILERQRASLVVETATSAAEGLEVLSDEAVDCVVSDYDMPGRNGIEFLETVREEYPDLPFILFTGKGSEEAAGEAISAGVTDYLQKDGGTDQYALLANRVVNAVDRARAERTRRRQLEAIEAAQEGIAILDADGHFTYVNETYAALYGYEPGGLVGEHWELVYPDDEVDFARAEVVPTAREEGRWHGRTTGLRADGTTFPEDHVLSATEAGELVCTVRDVSGREEREQELTRYRRLIEAIGDPVYVLDADGHYTYVNDAHVETFGYEREELLGEHASLIIPDRAFERGSDLIRELLADEDRQSVTWELENVTAEDEELVVENHLALLPSADGEFRGTVGVVRDITESRERERRLQRQNERLEELASVVSHDLRNPLNVAQGRAELARDDSDSVHLDAVVHALDRMETLVDDLLTLAREDGTVEGTEPVDLRRAVEGCWRTVDTAGATLITDTGRVVRADSIRLQQLLENLLRNAVEHGSTSPPSQTPEDEVDHGGDGVTVTVGDLPDGFYVADDGPGIPLEERETVFRSGYSTVEEGTGLGLAIVRGVAEAHGWTVTVTESAEGGARFEVTGVDIV